MPEIPAPEIIQPVRPSLAKEEITLGLSSTSEGVRKWDDQYDAAKEALERADANELFRLYEAAVRERGKYLKMFIESTNLYCGKDDVATIHALRNSEPQSHAVSAMERVAIAAIELAKTVASGVNG